MVVIYYSRDKTRFSTTWVMTKPFISVVFPLEPPDIYWSVHKIPDILGVHGFLSRTVEKNTEKDLDQLKSSKQFHFSDHLHRHSENCCIYYCLPVNSCLSIKQCYLAS